MSERVMMFPCSACGATRARASSGYLHTPEDCRDALAARITTAERELAEARATVTLLTEQRACDFRVMEGAQSLIAELTQERDTADTTRREWEVRAATSYRDGYRDGRAPGRASALLDVNRCMTEVSDVPDDCAALVTRIADTIAKADREAYATGRAAGLREGIVLAATTCRDESERWMDLSGTRAAAMCSDRILALLGPSCPEKWGGAGSQCKHNAGHDGRHSWESEPHKVSGPSTDEEVEASDNLVIKENARKAKESAHPFIPLQVTRLFKEHPVEPISPLIEENSMKDLPPGVTVVVVEEKKENK